MRRFNQGVLAAWLGIAALTAGCSSSSAPPATVDALATAKVDAFKRLADAMAKDPNGFEARATLEEIYSLPLNPTKNRQEAEQILDLYRQKIKGKYQGEVAMAVQGEIAGIENALKQAN